MDSVLTYSCLSKDFRWFVACTVMFLGHLFPPAVRVEVTKVLATWVPDTCVSEQWIPEGRTP